MRRTILLLLLLLAVPGTAHAGEIPPSAWSPSSAQADGRIELAGPGSLKASFSTRLLRGVDLTLRGGGCGSRVDAKLDGNVLARWRLPRGQARSVGIDARAEPGIHRIELRLRRGRGCPRPRLVVRKAEVREWIPLGSDMAWRYVDDDPDYMRLYAEEADAITAGVDMHWVNVHPERDAYDFEAADQIVEFGERQDKLVRGHPLVWDFSFMMPRWFNDTDWNRAGLIEVMRDHITTLVSRYRGRVDEWDVVNEPIAGDGSLRENVWLETIGPEYIEMAFRIAHEADPAAKLYVNEYDAEVVNAKSEGLHRLVSDLLALGVPLHGVGFQAHFVNGRAPGAAELGANFERFADLGVELQISEMDVADDEPDSLERRELQAAAFRDAAVACRAEPACARLTTWQLSDRYSWLGAERRPLPFDAALQPKPAWQALEQVMRPEAPTRQPAAGR
jgi:endo-1,4-beta-xylanase